MFVPMFLVFAQLASTSVNTFFQIGSITFLLKNWHFFFLQAFGQKKSAFGQNLCFMVLIWPNRIWPILVFFCFGQIFFSVVGCSWLFLVVLDCSWLVLGWCLLVLGRCCCCLCAPDPPPPDCQKFRSLFSLSLRKFHSFFFLWEVSLNFGGVFEDRNPREKTRRLWGLRVFTRQPELHTRIIGRPGASPEREPQREKKE